MKILVAQQIVVWQQFYIEVESIEAAKELANDDYSMNGVEPCSNIDILHDTEIVMRTELSDPSEGFASKPFFVYDTELETEIEL